MPSSSEDPDCSRPASEPKKNKIFQSAEQKMSTTYAVATHRRGVSSVSVMMSRSPTESVSSNGSQLHYYDSQPQQASPVKSSRWLKQVKSWIVTSEPSAQAMKEQKRAAYKKHGISRKDPQAAAKMHLPAGKLPKNAITSTSGPSPEEALAKERRACPAFLNQAHSSSQSVASSSSSGRSYRESNPVTPWE